MIRYVFLILVGGLGATLGHAQDEALSPDLASTPDVIEHFEKSRPWRRPDYIHQPEALGYHLETFTVPKGFERRVKFWIDIYSKYTTDQGVLHDAKYVHLVYEPVDFSDIAANPLLTRRERFHAREKKLKAAKERIKNILLKLDGLSSPTNLNDEETRIWNMFAEINEPGRFREAADKNRLRFQLGQRDRIQLGVYYSGRYLEKMEEIFREEGLPLELTRLPFVESSFNIYARSKVGASGIWQFMRSTAKSYMKVGVIDERNDPIVATRAAARKLRSNYRQLESWPLAITGYNHGPTGVQRMSQKLRTTDIVELIERAAPNQSRFGFASKNFYACFLAILEIEKNADVYLGRAVWSPPLEYREMRAPASWSHAKLVEAFNGNEEKARLYNPHLGAMVQKGRQFILPGTRLYVPVETDKIKN